MTVNKELTADFTYKDLKDIIVQAVGKYKTVMKFNIGFGIVLKNVNTPNTDTITSLQIICYLTEQRLLTRCLMLMT